MKTRIYVVLVGIAILLAILAAPVAAYDGKAVSPSYEGETLIKTEECEEHEEVAQPTTSANKAGANADAKATASVVTHNYYPTTTKYVQGKTKYIHGKTKYVPVYPKAPAKACPPVFKPEINISVPPAQVTVIPPAEPANSPGASPEKEKRMEWIWLAVLVAAWMLGTGLLIGGVVLGIYALMNARVSDEEKTRRAELKKEEKELEAKETDKKIDAMKETAQAVLNTAADSGEKASAVVSGFGLYARIDRDKKPPVEVVTTTTTVAPPAGTTGTTTTVDPAAVVI